MEFELRIVVEKVAISTQKVVERNTLKTYDIQAPESILEPRIATYRANFIIIQDSELSVGRTMQTSPKRVKDLS